MYLANFVRQIFYEQDGQEEGMGANEKRRQRMDPQSVPITFEDYRAAFQMPGVAASGSEKAPDISQERLKEALIQARDARKFEIDMYWKRATYFWAFIAAAFVGYASFLTGTNTHAFGAFLMSLIGFVFTLGWYLVNRGSKFWQENWENHVELLEDSITGPLFKVVARRPKKRLWSWNLDDWFIGPLPVSVSKVNGAVSLFVLMVWLELIAGAIGAVLIQDVRAWATELSEAQQRLYRIWILIALAVPALLSVLVLAFGTRSHAGSHHPELTLRSVRPFFVVKRNAPQTPSAKFDR